MSLPGENDPAARSSFPRVSGDEPQTVQDAGLAAVFSPRERG